MKPVKSSLLHYSDFADKSHLKRGDSPLRLLGWSAIYASLLFLPVAVFAAA